MHLGFVKLDTFARSIAATSVSGNDANGDPRARPTFRANHRLVNAFAIGLLHGVKFTIGAFSAPASAAKYAFSVNREPNIPTISTVGGVISRLVIKACAISL